VVTPALTVAVLVLRPAAISNVTVSRNRQPVIPSKSIARRRMVSVTAAMNRSWDTP
jgi:hypothetical protein